jgi:hypothetical protein
LDFKAIKESVPIQQVLEMLDIKHLTPHGEGLRGQCPLCQVTNPRGFVVTPAKNAWYCFSEKKGGDIIESLSGHIPRSWLRSSDLLPFYHQYPAACCGDFLFGRASWPGNPEGSGRQHRLPLQT